jgi:hypothetical protein
MPGHRGVFLLALGRLIATGSEGHAQAQEGHEKENTVAFHESKTSIRPVHHLRFLFPIFVFYFTGVGAACGFNSANSMTKGVLVWML